MFSIINIWLSLCWECYGYWWVSVSIIQIHPQMKDLLLMIFFHYLLNVKLSCFRYLSLAVFVKAKFTLLDFQSRRIAVQVTLHNFLMCHREYEAINNCWLSSNLGLLSTTCPQPTNGVAWTRFNTQCINKVCFLFVMHMQYVTLCPKRSHRRVFKPQDYFPRAELDMVSSDYVIKPGWK